MHTNTDTSKEVSERPQLDGGSFYLLVLLDSRAQCGAAGGLISSLG